MLYRIYLTEPLPVNLEGDDVQTRLDDVDLEFIRVNPDFWTGIRGFGVKRQMRAIKGQCNLTVALHGGQVGQETSGGSMIPICPDSCKGKAWGPHAIHICDFDS